MNATVVVMCTSIVVYLGFSALQWRRLKKGERDDHHPPTPGSRRDPREGTTGY